MGVRENLNEIRCNMAKACEKAGRDLSEVLLVGVTKTVDVSRINELICLGVKDIGENKVQEIEAKYPHVGADANWHLIGHLQTNKVKYIIDKVKLIHSVDSVKLLAEVDKRAEAVSKTADILVELNIAEEKTKHGILAVELNDFLTEAGNYSNIKVKGLMCVAPYVEKGEENRLFFRKMRHLFVDMSKKNINNIYMKYLSMGMTNDYQIAIEEGASIIRVGTGIFGERDYTVKY